MKRIAVLVSGGGTNLQALIDAQQRGELGGGEIAAVISTKAGAYALERAAKAGIAGFVLPRKDFENVPAMTAALVKMLRELKIDLVVMAGFMTIVTQSPSVTAPSVREPNELELALSKAAFGDWGPECCREWNERLHRGRRNSAVSVR